MHEIATQVILRELLVGAGWPGKDGSPYFIGWWSPTGYPVGQVGRLVQWLPGEDGKPRRCAYVILPSLESGVAVSGQLIPYGSERLTDVCSMEDMRRMFVEGLKRLKEVVDGANR